MEIFNDILLSLHLIIITNFIYKRNFSSTHRTLIISSMVWSYLFYTIRTKDMTTIQHNSWNSIFILLIVILLMFILLMFILLMFILLMFILLNIILLNIFYGFLWGFYIFLLNIIKITQTNRTCIRVFSIVYFCCQTLT